MCVCFLNFKTLYSIKLRLGLEISSFEMHSLGIIVRNANKDASQERGRIDM